MQKLPALLLCSFIWEVGVQSFSTQQKDRAWAWAALLSHKQRLVSCERWRDSSALVNSCEGKTLLPHRVDMSKKKIPGLDAAVCLPPVKTMGPMGPDKKWRWLGDEYSKRHLKARSYLLCWTLRILSKYLIQLPFLMSAIKPHEINHNCRLGTH